MEYSRRLRSKLAFCMIIVVALSCTSADDTKVVALASDYLPLRKGSFITYDVSQIKYVLGVAETSAFELKTVVVDSFVNATGAYSYTIYRYSRNLGESAWKYIDTWSAYTSNREAVASEQNIQFLKLKIPALTGFEWDGNAYNTKGEDTYTMDEVESPHTFAGLTFDDCITVNQSDNKDFIVFLDQRTEIYAKGVGMISKETTQLHYCTQTELGCLGLQVVDDGLVYKQTIKSYGTE